MKKFGFLNLLAMLIAFFATTAQVQAATLEIPDFTMNPGGLKYANLSVSPGSQPMFEYKGFQFDLMLQNGITVDSEQTTVLPGFTFSSEASNGQCRFVVFNEESQGPTTQTDNLMSIAFKASADIAEGTYPIQINNVIFSSPQGDDIYLDQSSFIITIEIVNIPVTSIEVVPSELTMYVGDNPFELLAIVQPLDATNTTVSWSSDNTSVATVNPTTGFVTPVAPGQCVVTATATDGSGVKGICNVTVLEREVPVSSISVVPSELTMYVGDSPYTLTAVVMPENATNKNVVWASNNTSVAMVDANTGAVTPVAPGQCVVTATSTDGSNIAGICNVIVLQREPVNVPVSSINVVPSELTMYVGDSPYTLSAIVMPENATNKAVAWTSSNTAIATVNSTSGAVTPVAPGKCVVTATAADGSGVQGYCNVTVLEKEPVVIPVTSITVDPSELTMYVGDGAAQVNAIIAPANATNQKVNWTSSDQGIAMVDQNGFVTPVAPGKCIVTATTTDGTNLSANCNVTVLEREPDVIPATSIVVNPSELTMYVGDSPYTLTATVMPENATNKTVVWSSSDASIARVDANTGAVTPVAPGKCIVTATTTDGTNLSANCNVTVLEREPEVIPVTSLVVTPSELEMTVGDNPFMLTAIVMPENATNKVVAWSSSDIKIATVDQNGYVTPVAPGTCIVTATTTDGTNLSGYCNVKVLEPYTPGPTEPETPQVPVTPIPGGTVGNANGTYVTPIKIREDDALRLGINEPIGGYEDAFTYMWKDQVNTVLGDEAEIYTPALLFGAAANSGVNQAISNNVYNVTVTNYGPTNEIFWQAAYNTANVEVYKRPQVPTQLLRKGQGNPEVGTSCTFVVMMTPLSNQQILDLGYTYTYGYTDKNGVMTVLETTEKRYTHTTYEIYNNPNYTFWAYSRWTYPDGSIVTSGLRYLDGSEDHAFNASQFTGTRGDDPDAAGVENVTSDDTVIGIYTLDGRYVGKDTSVLEHGIYIIRSNNSAKKIAL